MPAQITLSPTLSDLAPSFRRSLLAESKSPKTVKAYMEALGLLDRFLAAAGIHAQGKAGRVTASEEGSGRKSFLPPMGRRPI